MFFFCFVRSYLYLCKSIIRNLKHLYNNTDLKFMANKEKLFSEFQAPTTQEWLDKIEVDLKGADFQKRLVWRTNEGFNVQPFYRREDLKDQRILFPS